MDYWQLVRCNKYQRKLTKLYSLSIRESSLHLSQALSASLVFHAFRVSHLRRKAEMSKNLEREKLHRLSALYRDISNLNENKWQEEMFGRRKDALIGSLDSRFLWLGRRVRLLNNLSHVPLVSLLYHVLSRSHLSVYLSRKFPLTWLTR